MTKLVYLTLAVLTLMVVSCKKTPGCTDLDAENFYFEAEKDDGSCSYRGSAVFYHDSQTSQNLVNAGVTNVKLYVDGNFWDAMSPNVGFSFVPTCEHPDAMLMQNYGTGNQKTQSFTYSIKDQNEVELASGTFSITGNQCNAIEYSY